MTIEQFLRTMYKVDPNNKISILLRESVTGRRRLETVVVCGHIAAYGETIEEAMKKFEEQIQL